MLDRAFAVSVAVFSLGVLTGALTVLVLPGFRDVALVTFEIRMLAPMRTVCEFGRMAMFLFIFLNNSIAPALSFLYPYLVAKVRWTPPLTAQREQFFMGAFTVLASFLIGFFALGAGLAVAWELKGANGLLLLLSGAWLHGPLEFLSVLLCVAEPLRLVWRNQTRAVDFASTLRRDLRLMWSSLLGLLFAAAFEVFLGI